MKYCLYGERCSGTNYLQDVIRTNFNTNSLKFGHKHFFGFTPLDNSDDVLFVCIIRNIHDWISSFYRNLHQSPLKYQNLSPEEIKYKLLNEEFYSISDSDGVANFDKEILHDRHIYQNRRYKNIFELRHIKNKFLIDDLKNLVKNHILICYEELIADFDGVMVKLQNCNLEKSHDSPWKNTALYKKSNNKQFKPKLYNTFTKEEILSNKNYIDYYEKKIYGDIMNRTWK